RNKQVRTAKRAGVVGKEPPPRAADPVSGRALRDKLWVRRCGRPEECRTDDGGGRPEQHGARRPGTLRGREDRRSDVQPGNKTGRILPVRAPRSIPLPSAQTAG